MKLNTIMGISVALSSICGSGQVSAFEHGQTDASAVVKVVMDDAYGETYDAKNACWQFTFKDEQGESTNYCMRPGKPRVVSATNGKTLYLQSFSATDIRGDARYGYAQVQPGLMGAFKIHLDDAKSWKYEAFDKAMDYGTGGDCGCSDAKLVELDNSGKYGWLFASGGTWQGVTVSNFSIVTEIDGQIRDVSRIPQIREEEQNITYEVNVKAEPSARGMLPLHVVEAEAGAAANEFDVAFDSQKGVYALPGRRSARPATRRPVME